ncbi:MAG: hypothetical protein EB100_03665 [Crocinitomicaceae bacterium]|nr:hypothetical protein [Crocinitomicaceae bacterium]
MNYNQMKKVLIIVSLVVNSVCCFAQSLEEQLKDVYVMMDTAKTVSTITEVASQFELIAMMNPESYAANYYATVSKALLSYTGKDQKLRDELLDMANQFYEKAQSIEPSNQENFILGALLANARLSVDGGSRWKEQGEIFEKNLTSARAINPNNPRISHLKGVAVYFTPKMFGGGKKNALEYLLKSEELFKAETETSILKPHWGEHRNAYFLGLCREDK